jgi:hypothetical protein
LLSLPEQQLIALQATLELQEMVSGIRAQREADVMELHMGDDEEANRTPTVMNQIQLLLSPSILKPFFVAHIFNLFQIFTGTMLVVFYAVDMISEADKNTTGFNSFTVAQLTAFVRLVFTLVTNSLLYYVRRRTHAIVASSVCACSAITLSCFLFVQMRSYSLSSEIRMWILAILILIFIAANTCGFLPLPTAIMSEILPAKIRGVACGYIYAANDAMQFCASKLYPSLKVTLGMHGVFLLFGINALFCCILSYLFLPETQGKSLAQIEQYFRGHNLLWIKRDKGLGQHNTGNTYFEMKPTDTSGCVKTYSEEDQNIETEDKRDKCERKLSVTFS